METTFVAVEHCIGCRQCELACAVEHSKSKSPARAAWEEPKPTPRIFVHPGPTPNRAIPVRCHHCDPAPCERVCPTGALFRDEILSLVLQAPGKCISCAMCAMVCPFDVITFHPRPNGAPVRVTAVKCDGCVERRAKGRAPACVEACKTGALLFGELNALIAAGRARRSAALVAELVAEPSDPECPATVAAWREWGRAQSTIAKGMRHDHEPPR